MTPGDESINLLPGDLIKRRESVRRAIRARGVEYVNPEDERAAKKKSASFFGKLAKIFSRRDALHASSVPKPKQETKPEPRPVRIDLPEGKPLPSAMFAGVPAHRVHGSSAAEMVTPAALNTLHQAVPATEDAPDFIHAPAPVPVRSLPPTETKVLEEHVPQELVIELPHPTPVPAVPPKIETPQPIVPPKEEVKPVQAPARGEAKAVADAAGSGITEAPIRRKELFDVNLLSKEYSLAFNPGNPKGTLGLVIAVSIVIVAISYGGAWFYKNQGTARLAKLAGINTALAETIATYEPLDNEDMVIRRKVDITQKLLSQHISWKTFLARLESATIPEVTYITIAAAADRAAIVSAVAKDYTSLARQMTVFGDATPWVESVSVTSASFTEDRNTGEKGVAFDMYLTIARDALFAWNEEDQK